MISIRTKLSGHVLTLEDAPGMASGSRLADSVYFAFDDSWDGLARTALFWGADGDRPYAVAVDADGRAAIPAEVLAERARIRFGVCGVDGARRVTSTLVKYRVEAGAWAEDAANAGEPTPTVVEQLEDMAQAGAARVAALQAEVLRTYTALKNLFEQSGQPAAAAILDRAILDLDALA